MGLKKTKTTKDAEPEEPSDYENPFEMIPRGDALELDKIDLLRINWSLANMYTRELNNPSLTKPERHRLMNALSNHTSIINAIMKSAQAEIEIESEDLESKFLEISGGSGRGTLRARRIRINLEDLVEAE